MIQSATITGRAGCSGVVYRLPAERKREHVYRADLAEVVSSYIGDTEKNLVRVFDAVEGSDTLLRFDEADELFR